VRYTFFSHPSQAVDHPYLVIHSDTRDPKPATETLPATRSTDVDLVDGVDDEICGICRESCEDAVVVSCGHKFCKLCVQVRKES
jgi:hypothetical protein